jgi:RimK family alpha-L-glutamate ligase
MKLTILTDNLDQENNAWELQQLINLLKEKQVDFNLLTVDNFFEEKKTLDAIGSHVFQWKTQLIKHVQYGTFLELMKDKVIINGTQPGKLLNRYKSHQYAMVKHHSTIPVIETYMIREPDEIDELLKKNLLSYPFIQKPNHGSKGKGVLLVKKKEDLTKYGEDIYLTVLQPFVKNNGDYRVLMIGGEVLGVMKRVAKTGELVNNYSQGGIVESVTDSELTQHLTDLAYQVYQVFSYDFCGIDFIYDEAERVYKFMEINSIPGWKGFHKATGVKVEEKILEKYLTKA